VNFNAERDSLTPWINSLPEDWHRTRIDNVADVLFSNVDKHTIDEEEPVRLCNYIDVYKNDRITQKLEFMEASAEKREIQKFQVQRGDVLSTKDSETPDDIAISALVDEDLPGVLCGYHLALMRPRSKNLSGPYLAWVHSSKQFRAQYEASSRCHTIRTTTIRIQGRPPPPPTTSRAEAHRGIPGRELRGD
jgi:type I restriction enzyme, S subunit